MNDAAILVREEQAGDEPAIRQANDRAFGAGDEAGIVDALRAAGAVTLSLVAIEGGRVVGHVLFSPVSFERAALDAPSPAVLALAPMAVLPERQRQGIGTRLVREGLERLRRAGHDAVILVGHPAYYPRFGFVPAGRFGLRCEIDCPDEAFMALELRPGALAGLEGATVRFRGEFFPE